MKIIIILTFLITSSTCIAQSAEKNTNIDAKSTKKEKPETRTVKAKFDKEGNVVSEKKEQKTRVVKAKFDNDGKVVSKKEKKKTKTVKVKFDKDGNEVSKKKSVKF